jgi:hypothetical protein
MLSIGSPSVTWDDTDNCYAQKKNYAVQIVYTDVDGFADINVCEMFLKTGANVTRAEFAYVEDTNTFSTVSGSTEWDMSGSNTSTGNDITVTWNIKAQWDATEESDLDLFFFVNDTASAYANSLSDQNFDVVTRLVVSGLACDDSRINIGETTTISGTVYYGNNPGSNMPSTSYPPDAEFTSVSIHNSAHTVQATDNTIVNGAFSVSFAIPNAVQSNTYHAYINMADADYTDGDSVEGSTTAVVGDRIRIDSLGATNATARVNVNTLITFYATASLESDSHALGTGDSLTLSTYAFTWDAVDNRFEYNTSQASPIVVTINAFSSGNEATYGITAGNINSKSASALWDRVNILVFSAIDSRINVDDVANFTVSGVYQSDSTVWSGLYTLNDTTTKATVNKWYFNISAVTDTTYGLTSFLQNASSPYVIWDALTAFNVQTVQYRGSGAFYYQAQIEWAYDNTTINGATVGAAYPNGTGIGSVTSNSTGWLTFIINQGNATNGNFAIYGINDNNYTITVSYSNDTFTLYDWALNTKDIAGSAVSNTNLTVSKGATSVWSGAPGTLYVPTDTFAVSITWLQCPVNTTAAITISGATSTDFNCTVYPITGTTYHLASSSTVATYSYASEILSVSFSGATSTYILSVDSPKPTYIVNATYNFATDYTPYSALVLPHYGNATLKVSYEGWGDLYIQKTTHKLLTVTMASQVMSITATGTSGDIATIEVYCGSRGNPVTITGWTATTYSSTLKVLTGTLTFASDKTVTLTWTSSGTGTGTGTTTPSIQPLIATVVLLFPTQNTVGTTIQTSVNITWTGVTVISLQDIHLDSEPFTSWQLLVPDGLPQELTAFGTMGTATIPITLNIPEGVEPGSYIVPCIITFGWQQGAGTKTFRTVSTLDIVLPPPTVPDLMTYWWLLMFAGLGVGILVLRTKRRKY